MAPITPFWSRPSHPDVQEVVINEAEFTSKSLSKVALPPFGLFAKMDFPPCTLAGEATYATVQIGRSKHLNLNSDLLYINHSCEPSLIFDTTNLNVLAGPKGLQPGDELTFFYPSTEWSMAQPFGCLCGTPTCRGTISGAKDMSEAGLEGVWLNGHIRALLDEQKKAPNGNGHAAPPSGAAILDAVPEAVADPTAQALKDALLHAEKVVEAARIALLSYVKAVHAAGGNGYAHAATHGLAFDNGGAEGGVLGSVRGNSRRGPTSRELSGEMGGDTLHI